jgi:hypothetical protein
MTTNELKKLIESGDVEKIRFCAKLNVVNEEKPCWEVAVYGSPVVFSFGHCLTNSSRGRAIKDYSSLDRARLAMRKLGYKGWLEIDG